MQRRVNKQRVQELLQVELPQALLCYLLLRPLALPGGVAGGPLRLSLMSLVSTGILEKRVLKTMVVHSSHRLQLVGFFGI
jgi:hypothetical protein